MVQGPAFRGPVELGQVVDNPDEALRRQPISGSQGNAFIGSGAAKRDVIEQTVRAMPEIVHQGRAADEAGPPRLVVRQGSGIDRPDILDEEFTDCRAESPAGSDGRAGPSSEGQRDLARPDAFEDIAPEQHGGR